MSILRGLTLGDLDLTAYPFGVEFGQDIGSPENVYDVLVSLLSDGDISTSTRVNNRTITFSVLVEGASLTELAANEAALVAECDKQRNTLTIDPGDGAAPSTVFETFRVQAALQYDDTLEQAKFRRYQLTIPASPYPRAESSITTAAQTAGETLIDNGSSTTNWSATVGTGLSVVSGAVQVSSVGGTFHSSADIKRTASVSLSTAKYLRVQWTTSQSTNLLVYIDGVGKDTLLSSALRLGSGPFDEYFAIPAGTTTTSKLRFAATWAGPTGGKTLGIDNVSWTTALPYIGTTRQKALSLTPGGSVRTQGSIAVTHATSALGKTIVYTHPSGTGYLPPLRPWRFSSDTVSADASSISGSTNTITAAIDYRVPVSVIPQGRTEIWARLFSNTAATVPIFWAADSWMSAQVGPSQNGSTDVTWATANTWQIVFLGAVALPATNVGPSGYHRISIQRFAGSSATVFIDEAWLFATDRGRLTVVDCGTGTLAAGGPSNQLWIDAPNLDQPQGAVFRGNAADRSDAWHAGSVALPWQIHDFEPTGTNVFVATENATDASTSLTHYRRYHTHVASL